MSIFAISGILIGILGATEGLFMFFKGNAKVHYLWGMLCFTTMIWGFGGYKIATSLVPLDAIFWWHFAYIGVIFIPIFLIHFTYEFVGLKRKFDIYLYYLIGIIFLSANVIDDIFIRQTRFVFGEFYYLSNPTISYNLFFLFFLFSVLLSLFLIRLEYARSSGIKRIQIRYILIALAIGFGGGSFSFLPVYGVNFYPFLNILVSIGMMIVAYAIFYYRLMDIRVAVRNIFIYAGIATFTYALFYFVVWAYAELFGGVFNTASYLFGLIIAPLFVMAFLGVNKFFQNLANKYLFTGLYSYQTTINKLSQELNYSINLQKIIDLIVDTIIKTMELERVGMLLISKDGGVIHYRVAMVVGFNEKNGISLVDDNFLTKYLQETKTPLVKEEIDYIVKKIKQKSEIDNFLRLKSYMTKIEASLCLPLLSNKKLIGIIVLGSKISGDAYSKEDLDLLSTLSYQAGIAINNAKLYKEVQDFSQILKQKVAEQTKDISKKNQYLQELLNMKTDFLRVVNHQLNTPLSIMKIAYSMVKDHTFSAAKGFFYAEAGLNRMDQTISDFWDAFQLEGEKMEMNPEPVDLARMIASELEEKKKLKLAQERKLKLAIEKPAFSVPLVWCDPKRIIHVISNLLDNAVFYTSAGSVKISYDLDANFLKVNIKDTGVGISEKNKENIFQKFSRGVGATVLHPDGSGLGLYIAKKIVEGSDGQLTYFSAGENKGSTFSFSLPLYKNQQSVKRDPSQPREIIFDLPKK